jgi:signal transduction histidine kinase
MVDPSKLARLSGPPPVVTEAVRVAGQPIPIAPVVTPALTGSRVALPPDPRGVEIEIATRGFTRPSNARVMHRLEGFDADWIEHPIDRPIRYERLPAGEYTLRLRSEHDLGVWENDPQSFVIDVRPLLWERPWFRVAMLAVAAGIAAAAAVGGATLRNRSRLARLEQQAALERQRMRIARDMHDEAGTTATQLSLLADLARGPGDGPARAERLEGVSRIARQLVTSLDEMVWAVNPANDTLAHLVSYLGQTASETLGRFGVACRVRTQEPLPECTATAELRRGILMIAKEAVSNIVEHAGATVVEIDLSIHEGRVWLSIADDGCGLPEATNGRRHGPGGNGLGNMQSRAKDLGGSCRIETASPRGTRVVVEVPLSREAHA